MQKKEHHAVYKGMLTKMACNPLKGISATNGILLLDSNPV